MGGCALWRLKINNVISLMLLSTMTLFSINGSVSGWVVFSNIRKKMRSSPSASFAFSYQPLDAAASCCRRSSSASPESAIVCIVAPDLASRGTMLLMMLSRDARFLLASLSMSTSPSVSRIMVRSISGLSCFQSQVDFWRVSSILVNRPLERISPAALVARRFHCLSTGASGTSMLTWRPKVQTPACALLGSRLASKRKAGMRRLSGSFHFMLPETSIRILMSYAAVTGSVWASRLACQPSNRQAEMTAILNPFFFKAHLVKEPYL